MRVVASGIASVLEEHLSVSASLRDLTGQKAVLLLGIDAGDQSFLGLEVEGHRVALILVASHLEDRRTRQVMGRGVHLTRSMHHIAVQAHEDILAGQVHILVLHLRITIEIGARTDGIIGQRVVGRILHRRVDTVLTAAIHAVTGQGVVHHLIIFIDGQLNRVHRCGIAFGLDGGFSPGSLFFGDIHRGHVLQPLTQGIDGFRHLLDGQGVMGQTVGDSQQGLFPLYIGCRDGIEQGGQRTCGLGGSTIQ